MSQAISESVNLELQKAALSFAREPEAIKQLDSSESCFRVESKIANSKKRKELFLKRSKKDPSLEITTVAALKEGGFKALPEFYKQESGEAFFLSDTGNYWTCQAFLKSERNYDWLEFNCSGPDAFLAGQLLAELHATGSRLLKNTGHFRALPLLSRKLACFPEQFQKTVEEFEKKKERNEIENENPLCRLDYKRLLSVAAANSKRLIEFETKSKSITILHGDYHPGNLIYSPGGIAAVLDWEFARIGSSIYDLCIALFMFCLQLPAENGEIADLFKERQTEAFLDGYNRTAPIRSMQHLKAYTEFVHLLLLDWLIAETNKNSKQTLSHKNYLRLAQALYCCF